MIEVGKEEEAYFLGFIVWLMIYIIHEICDHIRNKRKRKRELKKWWRNTLFFNRPSDREKLLKLYTITIRSTKMNLNKRVRKLRELQMKLRTPLGGQKRRTKAYDQSSR